MIGKDMIRNPLTGRNIKIRGPTYQKLISAGYICQGDNLVIPVVEKPVIKILYPPFPTDVIPIIYSFLEFKDIMSGYFVNRIFATAISHGFNLYGRSIIEYMLTMRFPGKILKYIEPVLSDNDILMYFSMRPCANINPYWMHISMVDIYLGKESRSWSLLSIYLLIKTNKDIDTLYKEYGFKYDLRTHYIPMQVYNLSYDTDRLLPYTRYNKVPKCQLSIEDKILKSSGTISDIQIACMKYGLLGYSKINGKNKNDALSELKSIISN